MSCNLAVLDRITLKSEICKFGRQSGNILRVKQRLRGSRTFFFGLLLESDVQGCVAATLRSSDVICCDVFRAYAAGFSWIATRMRTNATSTTHTSNQAP